PTSGAPSRSKRTPTTRWRPGASTPTRPIAGWRRPAAPDGSSLGRGRSISARLRPGSTSRAGSGVGRDDGADDEGAADGQDEGEEPRRGGGAAGGSGTAPRPGGGRRRPAGGGGGSLGGRGARRGRRHVRR